MSGSNKSVKQYLSLRNNLVILSNSLSYLTQKKRFFTCLFLYYIKC